MFAINSGALYLVPAVQSNVKPTPTRFDVIEYLVLIKLINFSCLGKPRENQIISGLSSIISLKYISLVNSSIFKNGGQQ